MEISHSFITFFLFSHLVFSSLASTQLSSPSTDQTKFWFQNVQNKMPQAILKKLSPLSKKDCDFFSGKMSGTENVFKDYSNLCMLAKLACTDGDDAYHTLSDSYNIYGTHTRKMSIEDPFSFFRISLLNTGSLIHLSNLTESLPDRTFLPKEIASKLSLVSADNIFNMFMASPSSVTRETIETSIANCNSDALKGEVKSCPKSIEEMILFAKSTLGGEKLLSLTSESSDGSSTELLISNMKMINSDKIVVCHEVFLPFATYFCHSISSSKLYQVDLVEPKSRAHVNTLITICHMDTSQWPANHIALQILKLSPGEGEACHWFSQLDLAWIPEG